MADYFGHWLSMGQRLAHPPAIFHVNWFRTGHDGRFLWPGFGENLRVLLWMMDRVKGRGRAVETAVGMVPTPDALNLDGIEVRRAEMEQLLRVDRDEWAAEVPEIRAFFDRFGDRLPESLNRSLDTLASQVTVAAV
jgi:phosphoenolpyruvate carboxykinase (GTP)